MGSSARRPQRCAEVKKGFIGGRGEGWVLAQFGLFALFQFVPLIGPIWPARFAFRVVGGTAAVMGVAVIAASAINLGRSLTPFPRPLPSAHLVTDGAFRLVRQLIYFSVLLTALGYVLYAQSPLRLLLTLVLAIFFDLKADREEKWLSEQYADDPRYCARVKKQIPWIY